MVWSFVVIWLGGLGAVGYFWVVPCGVNLGVCWWALPDHMGGGFLRVLEGWVLGGLVGVVGSYGWWVSGGSRRWLLLGGSVDLIFGGVLWVVCLGRLIDLDGFFEGVL